jgi:SAM-dependent methyltransferase
VTVYDSIGRGYRSTRRPDPRIAAQIRSALHGMRSVVNVGAGAGSYEPPATTVAVEPSQVMVDQRPPGAASCVRAVAEALPLRDGAVDAALAVLTIHHWTDLATGIAELRRVARRRIVVLTWDPSVFSEFWLLRDYLADAAAVSDRHAASARDLTQHLPGARIEAVPVPHDCADGFGAAFWRRPQAYLDPAVRAGISMLAQAGEPALRGGLTRLADDLRTGRWHERNAALLDLPELDVGYRLVIGDPCGEPA